MRAATAGGLPPTFSAASTAFSFTGFLNITVDDITSAICRLPDKRCVADTLPTPQLKLVADLIASFLAELFSRSLSTATLSRMCSSRRLRQLFVTWEFSSTQSLVSRTVARGVLLCYDSSAASDVQCSIRWLCRWLYHVSTIRQRNTRRTSCVPAPSTSVGVQRRRQTDTSIFSVWALHAHADAARLSLAAISGTHQLQVGCVRLPMPAWSGRLWRHGISPTTSCTSPIPTAAVSGRRHPHSWWSDEHGCRCWRSCVSGGWKPPLEQSAAWRYLSSNADCFREPLQTHLFPIISFPTFFGF